MKDLQQNTPLVIIDIQKAFEHPRWGARNNKNAEDKAATLIHVWREKRRPIFFVQHMSNHPDSLFYINGEGVQFMEQIQPVDHEVIIQKEVNSAFIGTDLYDHFIALKCKRIVIAGLTTNHCVETTTRMAGNFGFNPILVEDACATFDRIGPNGLTYKAADIHQMTLVNLNEEFADIITTDKLIFS